MCFFGLEGFVGGFCVLRDCVGMRVFFFGFLGFHGISPPRLLLPKERPFNTNATSWNLRFYGATSYM